nr:MAG TPA: hypothetical protein [Caudoviricetes sp.]
MNPDRRYRFDSWRGTVINRCMLQSLNRIR